MTSIAQQFPLHGMCGVFLPCAWPVIPGVEKMHSGLLWKIFGSPRTINNVPNHIKAPYDTCRKNDSLYKSHVVVLDLVHGPRAIKSSFRP